jgi:hypothetical protein
MREYHYRTSYRSDKKAQHRVAFALIEGHPKHSQALRLRHLAKFSRSIGGDNVSKLTTESVIEMSTTSAGGLVSRR